MISVRIISEEIVRLKGMLPPKGAGISERALANEKVRAELPRASSPALAWLAFHMNSQLSLRELRERVESGRLGGSTDSFGAICILL
jgi:hypothetical protein